MTIHRTSLTAVLIFTALASVGTGVFWFGLGFIAHSAYGFDASENLLFHMVLGAVYAGGSFVSGRVSQAFRGRLHSRQQLGVILTVMSMAGFLPMFFDGVLWLWVSALTVSLFSAFMWPMVESYLTADRKGEELRKAISHFNLVWMPATMVPMFLMAPIIENHARLSFGLLAIAFGAAGFCLPRFREDPRPHGQDEPESASPRYVALLQSARYLLPASYLLLSVLGPLMPYRLDDLGVPHWMQPPLTATWMVARVMALVVMARFPFWRGRWDNLLLAGGAMTLGFAGVVIAPNVATLAISLAILGLGLGGIYNTALYYAMSVGHGEVDAAGTHEALIGLGYTLGPLTGWAGVMLGGAGWVVGLSWAWIAVIGHRAAQPYLLERKGKPPAP